METKHVGARDMTMSLFHNFKLKRAKVDSRPSIDIENGPEPFTELISEHQEDQSDGDPSFEVDTKPTVLSPVSSNQPFEVEIKPKLEPPKYTSWASPAKSKTSNGHDLDRASSATIAHIGAISSSGPSSSSAVIQVPQGIVVSTVPRINQEQINQIHHHHQQQQLQLQQQFGQAQRTLNSKLFQSVTSGMMPTSSSSLSTLTQPTQALSNIVFTSAQTVLSSMNGGNHHSYTSPTTNGKSIVDSHNSKNSSPSESLSPRRSVPTVILGEHGGVKTMVWTVSSSQKQNYVIVDREQQMKMSSAVDGLLSLSSNGTSNGPTTTISPTQMSLPNMHPLTSINSPSTSHPSYVSSSSLPLPTMGKSLPSPTLISSTPNKRRSPMNMERLWAGDKSQLPSHGYENQNGPGSILGPPQEDDEPLICNICEDKATGLHYGIITCEGCKGFFKRTVQNKRVYTCVADGHCEINKQQRNRCQYCRFQKCLRQGMVLAAVREDRMPGGRNSGAVYNMYKVKYKKHKRGGSSKMSMSSPSTPMSLPPPQSPALSTPRMSPAIHQMSPSPSSGLDLHSLSSLTGISRPSSPLTSTSLKYSMPSPQSDVQLYHHRTSPSKGLLPGGINILRAALTGSPDIPHQYRNLNRQNKEKNEEHHQKLINELIARDEFEDIATLKNIAELLNQEKSDLEQKLCQIGDSIVYKLVQWTRRLPFFNQLSVNLTTRLLTHKWHELLVLTTSAYQAIHGTRRMGTTRTDGEKVELHQEVATNLVTLQTCLTKMMGKPISMDQLHQDVGNMVEKITKVIAGFRHLQLKMEEYVCLKVISMVSAEDDPALGIIYEKYLNCLRTFTRKHFPNQPNRVEDLLVRLPEVKIAASLLLESKMFYVPFLLNSSID